MNAVYMAVGAGFMIARAVSAQVDLGDVILGVQHGQIVTGSGVVGGVFQPTRVYAAEFGAVVPDSTDEPGFDCEPSTFPASSSNGFRILDVLRRWDGQGFDMQAVPALEIGYVGQSVQTPSQPGVVEGLVLPVGSNGQWHRHFDYTLLSPATPGVYLLTLSVFNTSPFFQESEPFWIVFGQEVDAGVLSAAVTWAQEHLPGPPACSDIDFNNDGLVPDTQDISDFIEVFGGAPCPSADCDGIDFNGDGLSPDVEDIGDFLAVFAGGTC